MFAHGLLELSLFVGDVDTSAKFYRAIGVRLFPVDEPGHPHHYDGAIGDTVVQLFPAGERPVTRIQLGFRVTSLEEVREALHTIGTACQVPGPHRLQTRDPDGNRIHVSQIPSQE